MPEEYQKYFNAKDYLRKNLPLFTESFVSYYGEQERDFINDKFSHCIIYAYIDPFDMDILLEDEFRDLDEELTFEFLDKVGIPTDENIDSNLSISLKSLSSLMNYFKEEPLTDTDIENIVSFLQTFFSDEGTVLFEDIVAKHNVLDWKNVFLAHEKELEKLKKTLELSKPPYQEIEEYVEKHEDVLRAIEFKYNIQFIKEFAYLLPPKEQEYLETLLKKEEITEEDLNGHFTDIAGDVISLCGNIEAFAEDIENHIKNQTLTESVIAELKVLRMLYFINHGINHGCNYEAYENDPECKKIIPSQETIEKLNNRRNHLATMARREFYQLSHPYNELCQELAEKGIVTKQDLAAIMMLKETCTIPAVKKATGENYPIILINLYPIIGNEDHMIVHELNHVLEQNIFESDGNMKIKLGFDIIDAWSPTQEDRKREILDEAINERIATDISTMMEEEGTYIFTNPNFSNRPQVTYRYCFPLIEPLYQKYRADLIRSRQQETFDECDRCFGMDNIDALASVCEEAFKYICKKPPGYYQDEESQVRDLNNFIKGSEAIMQNIASHRLNPQKEK